MRLVILGGGGFRVPLVYRALAARSSLGIDEVVLFDVDGARSKVIAAVLQPKPGIRIRLTDSLPEALTGADVVFSAIRVGGAAGRVRDERRALEAGVLGQETVGAGGLSFGLRTLPVVLRAAELQAELAPKSWLINFTNPAGMITQALSTVLGPRVVGICDSPVGLIRRAVRALGVAPSGIEYDYAGLNHLGWLTGLRQNGADLLGRLLADDSLLQRMEEGRLFDPQLLRSLRAIPNEYLHFYYSARELTASLSRARTRGEVVLAEQEDFYRAAGQAMTAAGQAMTAAGQAPAVAEMLWEQTRAHREQTYLAEARLDERDTADLSGGGYEQVALDVAEALTTGVAKELIVNARNGSAYPQLPAELVLETRCVVDATGARPLPGPALHLHQLGLMASVRAAEQSVIDAVRTRDRAAAVHGFAIHPLIGSRRIAARLVESTQAQEPSVAALFSPR
ncbi:MAG: 6-phospho-beta-glucosidase [Actinomycetota bacterium]|nr:6-phospho-beta-glucosidase [Actinomycetota bacterium]